MQASNTLEREQAEVEAVLQSGVFGKAPRMERFFRYICREYLAGRADGIKEYSIAVEALHRPSEFDPKKDSIVRVEAHRLRKRLHEFYKGPGVGHEIHIVIPNGQYRPTFLHVPEERVEPDLPTLIKPDIQVLGSDELSAVTALALTELPSVTAPVTITRRPPWLLPIVIVTLVAVGATAALFLIAGHKSGPVMTAALPRITSETWVGPAAEYSLADLRILTGYHGIPFEDRQGHTWAADAFYTGGISSSLAPERFVEAQPDPHLIKAQRSGQFRYDIPLRQATYELHLYFAETEFGGGNPKGGDGARGFNIFVNGQQRLESFDPLASAGAPNRLYALVFKDVRPAQDGKLHLAFNTSTGPAFINAIEILQTAPGRIHPVRIVTQHSPVTDADGRFWAADEYFCGGMTVFRRNVVVNGQEKVLYQGERYGNFSYHIPLAPGRYRLTLHFAETWFGTPESHEPARDRRLFDVFANGTALLRNYEIAADAGGSNRSVDKVFEKLQPNAQGMLLLQFVPVKNYAEVNAIEVVETE